MAIQDFSDWLRNEDDEVVRDVIKLYEYDLERQIEDELDLIAEVGKVNYAGEGCVDGLGKVEHRPTVTDYWAARALYGDDPEFWDWYAKQPDGEYCKVRYNPEKTTIFVSSEQWGKVRWKKSYG